MNGRLYFPSADCHAIALMLAIGTDERVVYYTGRSLKEHRMRCPATDRIAAVANVLSHKGKVDLRRMRARHGQYHYVAVGR